MATISFANVQIGGSIKALNPVSVGFNIQISANVNFEDRQANRKAQTDGITRVLTLHESDYATAKATLASEFDAKQTAIQQFVTEWNAEQTL